MRPEWGARFRADHGQPLKLDDGRRRSRSRLVEVGLWKSAADSRAIPPKRCALNQVLAAIRSAVPESLVPAKSGGAENTPLRAPHSDVWQCARIYSIWRLVKLILLIDIQKGERTAQSYENACFRQLGFSPVRESSVFDGHSVTPESVLTCAHNARWSWGTRCSGLM
jgi:hypothetical protein